MLAPWASRRRRELLELFDRIHLAIGELTAAVEQEVQKRPDAQRLSKGIPYGVTFSAGKERRHRHWERHQRSVLSSVA